jgi:type I restriction enzyme S subunit
MEVKPGYKQTEVGVIPVEWYVRLLGDVATIRDGTHQTPKYVPSGVPFYSVEHVTSGDFRNTKFISEQEHRFLTRSFKIEKGDILMTRIGSIGDCKLIDWDVDASFYVSLALLKIRQGHSAAYIAHYSKSTSFQKEVELHSLQSAIPKKINLGPISNVRIVIPTQPEQSTIATALSDVDGLLGGLDRLIAKKRDLKQAAMQQLLTGQTRLPGFHGEWEVKRLGDVCRITTGKKDVNEGNPDGQFPFFTCSRSHTFSDSYSFDTEAILIAGNGEVGNLHYINGKFEAYQRTYVLCAFSAHVRYLWQQLSAYLADSLGLGKIGSSIPYIKKENLVGFEFNSPRDPAEQTAIASVLTEMDVELAVLEQRREKTRALKQAMMQELLTGRTRLV